MMDNVITVCLYPKVGAFAEDKDVARDIREQIILPGISRGKDVCLDFEGVTSATQSFVHALISEVMRKYTADVLDRIDFKNCNESVQRIIVIVADYMQQSDAA